MPEGLFNKEFGALKPADDATAASFMKVRNGTSLIVEYRINENETEKQRKFAFALLGIMFDSQEAFKDFDKFRYYVLAKMGRCEVFRPRDGDPIAVPHSMKRSSPDFPDVAAWSGLIDDIISFGTNSMGIDPAALTAEARRRAG